MDQMDLLTQRLFYFLPNGSQAAFVASVVFVLLRSQLTEQSTRSILKLHPILDPIRIIPVSWANHDQFTINLGKTSGVSSTINQ